MARIFNDLISDWILFTLTFLGTRGTAPCLLDTHQRLGGETSCVQIDVGGHRLFLDAGTGLRKAAPSSGDDYLILSHLHIDHMLGLAEFAARKKTGQLIIVSAMASTAIELENLVGKVYGPPAYPVSIRQIYARVVYQPMVEFTQQGLDSLHIEPITLHHPGGSYGTLIRHLPSGQAAAYLSDHEHGSTADHTIATQCTGIDMLIWDASYDDNDFAARIGHGHSTWQQGVAMGQRCGAKAVALTHHDVTRSDHVAMQIESEIAGTIAFLTHDDLRLTL